LPQSRILSQTIHKNNEILANKLSKDIKEKLGLDELYLPEIESNISLDEFYSYFEPLTHPDTREPVTHLADHQREVWDDQFKYLLRGYPKSQKIYLSTTFLFEDIYHALTDAMGMEIIIIGQSEFHSQTHLQDFKKLILTSQLKDYLIREPIKEIGLERNEITKATVAYMHNPKNPFWPTKIYALPPSAGSLISLKRVKHVHASDITRSKETPEKQKEAIASMFSRLANSVGSMVLEAPFRGMSGPLFEFWEKYKEITEKGIDLSRLTKTQQQAMPMYIKEYDYHYGIKSGAFTPEFIEGEKIRLGPLFDMYYGAKPYESDQSWFTQDMFQTSQEANDFFSGIGL